MQKNPVKAIREFCLDCSGGSFTVVKECTTITCPLHPFRFGKNPFRTKREMTEEQKEAAKVRLADARNKRVVQNNDNTESNPS